MKTNLTQKSFVALIAFVALMCATETYAATKTWVSGATWNTAVWSPTGNPVSGDDVILPTGCSITSLGTTIPASGSLASLTLNGTAALGLNNTFSVSGLTAVTGAGTISAVNNSGTRTWGDISIATGGTFGDSQQTTATVAGSITNNGTFNLTGNCTYTLSGASKVLIGTIGFQKAIFTGTYKITAGSTVAFPGNSGAGLTVNSPGVLDNFGVVTANYGSGNPMTGSGQFINDTNGSISFGTEAGGAPNLTTFTHTAPGNTVISGGNGITLSSRYGGSTFGNVQVNGGGNANISSVTINGELTVGSAATANPWGADTIGSGLVWNETTAPTGTLTPTLGGNVYMGGSGSATLTIGGVISDGSHGFSFAKIGTSPLTLSPATPETYTGNTIVNQGTLTVSFASATTPANGILSTSSGLVFGSGYGVGNGTLTMLGKSATVDVQTVNGLTLAGGGNIIINSLNSATSSTLNLGAIAARSAGGGTVDFQPSGTTTTTPITTTTGNNSAGILGGYATVAGGDWATVDASSPKKISAYSSYTTLAAGSGTGTPTANFTTTGGVTLTGNVTGNSLRNVGGSLNLGGFNLTVAGGASGASGGVIFGATGNNAIAGSGTLSAGSGNELIIFVVSGQTATIPGGDLIGANSGSLTKSGPGGLTLSTTPSYTGPTTIHQGTLTMTAGALAGNVIVDAGATMTIPATTFGAQDLAGSGTISGALATMGASTTLHPGGSNSYGTLTFGTGLTVASGTTATFDLNGPNTLLNDKIAVTGTLTCGSGHVVINPGPNFAPGVYTLATATTVSGTFNTTVTFASGTGTAALSYTGTSVILTVSSFQACAIPASFTVGGGTNCSTSGITLTLSGAEAGTTYFVRTNGVINGASTNAVGTGQITFTNTFTGAGSYTVLASNSCGNTLVMGGSALVSQNPTATYNVTGGAGCSSLGVTIGLSSSDVGVDYQLIRGGSTVVTTVAGTGAGISFGSQSNAGTYTVTGTNIGCGSVAINGGSPSSVVIAQTPGAPTGLTPLAGNNDISLTWAAPSGTVTDYSVYRTAANGATNTETLLAASTSGLTTYDDPTAANGSVYYYKVTALNGSCESVKSSEVFATPNPSFSAFTITTSDPTTTTAGTNISVTITAVDSSSATVSGVSGVLPLTFSGLGTAPDSSAATVSGTANGTPVAVTFASGTATVTLVAHKAESATLHVTDNTHTDTSTGGNNGLAFTIGAGNDSAYRLSLATGAPAAGANDALTITLVDQFQNASTFTGNKTITFGGLSTSPNGTVPTVAGTNFGTGTVITFGNPATVQLVATKSESGRTLTATDGTLTTATTGGATASLSPTAGTATQIGVVTQPSSTATAGTAFAVQPVVNIQDAYGNVATTSTASVDVTEAGGTLLGQHPTNAVAGVASFSGLAATNAGSVTLVYSSSGLTSTNSSAITVSALTTISGLAWTTTPGSAVHGAVFGTQPVLQTVDAFGNPITTGLPASVPVTISVAGGGTLSGTTSTNIGLSFGAGKITFTDLKISGAGAGKTLVANLQQGYGTPASGMSIWLDASVGVGTNATGSVTNWIDQSGNLNNFTNFSTGTSPTYLNTVQTGRKAVTFVSQRMSCDKYTGNNTTISVFIVYKGSGSRELSTYASSSGADDYNTTKSFEMDPPGGAFAGKPHFFRNNTGTGTFTYDSSSAYHAEEFISDGTNDKLFVSAAGALGTAAGSTARNSAYGITRVSIGGGITGGGVAGNGTMAGDVCEVLIYNTDQSANRTAIETYLQNKWMTNTFANYSLVVSSTNTSTASFTVAPAPVNITNGLSILNKFADGTTSATLVTNSSLVLSGVLPADTANITLITNGYVANFADTNIGTWAVTVTGLTLGGTTATNNYSLNQPTNLSASISSAPNYTAFQVTGAGSILAGDSDTVTISAVDSGGNVATNFTSPGLTLTFTGLGTAPDGSTATINGAPIGGPVTVGMTNGVAVVTLVAHNAETGVTLNVSDTLSHSSTTSPGFGLGLNVSVGPDSAYRITASTSTPQVGASDTLTLNIVDAYRNASGTTGNKNITFGGLASAPDGSSATADGTAFGTPTTISFSGGTASSTLVAHKVQTSALLTATDGSLTAAAAGGTAPSFSPTAGAAASLGISTQPSSTASAGVAFGQQPVVTVLDQYLNTTTSNALVLATASAGTLQGTTTVTANGSGIATYAGLNLTNAGSITLTFSSTGLSSTNSSAITVGGGTATQLVWATAPGGAVNGSVFATQPVLRTADAFGNYSSTGLSANEQVTVYLSAGTGPLLGTTNYNIGSAGSNGIVTFTDLQVNSANTNATLTATLFSPAATSLAAAAPLWLDANNTASITTNGSGVVSAWNNIGTRGGTLHVATAGGTWTGPTWTGNSMNGKAVMKFVAASSTVGNVMTNSFSPALNLGPNVHLFLAIRQPVNPNGFWSGFIGFSDPAHSAGKFDSTLGEDCGQNGTGVTNGFRFFRNDGDASPTSGAAGQFNLNNGLSLGGGVHNMRPANNVAFVNQFYWSASANSGNGAASDNWVDGLGNTWTNYQPTAASKGNFNFVDFGLGAQLGANNDQPVWAQTMDIAEVITYTNVLSASDSAAIFSYLANKWMNTPLADASTSFTVAKATTTSAVASSSNPSGFNDSLTFTDTVTAYATATGNVVFKVDGVAFSTNTLNGSDIATSIATTSLTRGTRTITAEYAGDSNFNGVTNDLTGGQVVTNHPPVINGDTLTRGSGGVSMKIPVSSLLTNDTDADSDTITLDSVSATTANGATVTLFNGTVFVGTNGSNDSFTYTADDGHGGTNTATVTLNITTSSGQQTAVTPTPSNATAYFYGIPGQSYTVQRATNVGFTLGVSNFPSTQAPSGGAFNITDDFGDLGGVVPGSAFYRLLVP